MFDYLSDLGVDGHTISPAGDDAAKGDTIKRLNACALRIFFTPSMTIRYPESGGMDESIHVSRHAGLLNFAGKRTTRSASGDSNAKYSR